ncbi:MAG: thymidylate kinase, partial [Clostridia bacterium]|nr:thymidylate kinase [Clostridia bacterium]
MLDFPCYGSFFGSQIGVFLSGSGSVSAADVDVRSMSLWYAMDRVKAFEQFDAKAYDVILLNRSTMANAAYQGSRVQLEAKKR